jgi:hypothetical protein
MEIEYLNLGMVNETRVAMEVEPILEVEIREGQLEEAKLKEILSYPVPRKRERSLHMCAQDVQITRMATIDKQMQCYK